MFPRKMCPAAVLCVLGPDSEDASYWSCKIISNVQNHTFALGLVKNDLGVGVCLLIFFCCCIFLWIYLSKGLEYDDIDFMSIK